VPHGWRDLEQAAEHIALTIESLGNGDDRPKPYITFKNSEFRDAIGTPVLKHICLPRRTVQHIFSVGQHKFAAAYRDMVFDMNDALFATVEAVQDYNEKKGEAHLERSAAHQEMQNFVRESGLIAPRQKRDGTLVSATKQASAKAAGLYGDFYKASIHRTKRPRKAAKDVGVEMTSKPIIHQTTDVCMQGLAMYAAKVRRKMALAKQSNIEMTMDQAQRQVTDEDTARGTYIQQDLHGNDYSEDDQVRAMMDDGFAAVGVASSTLLALPAPQ